MLIDTHVHTNRYSACSRMSPEELIFAAKVFGLDGVVITEHNIIWEAWEIDNLKAKTGAGDFVVLRGQEARVYNKGKLQGDLLVFGFYESLKDDISLEELIPRVHQAGGVVIAAHPFRGDLGIGQAVYEADLDGIEVFNSNHGVRENLLAREAQIKLGLAATGGSDAHTPAYVGNYLTYFDDRIENETQLVQAIKQKRCKPVTYTEVKGKG